VILYHLGYRWMRGGFLGVDIFFVLSGYLITSLLLKEHAVSGRIRLPTFWARRAKRLFPALGLAVLVIALCIRQFDPLQDWPMLRQDLLWTVFYGANWHQIATDQNYFAQWATASPLRHMWSLAIEEQFYIAWPLALLLLARRSLTVRLVAIVLAIVASLVVMAFVYDPAAPSRVYYGTDSRGHELLIGALLALILTMPAARDIRLVRHAGLLGVAAAVIVVGALALLPDSSSLYYRGGSLGFCLVVAVLLWCIEVRPLHGLARLLGLALPRWIGQISYGLYLWHWPAILFTSSLLYQLFGQSAARVVANATALNGIRVGITFAVATLSFYLLEQPIRQGQLSRFLTNRRLSIATPLAAALVLAVVVIATQVPLESQALVLGDSYQCPHDAFVCVRHQGTASRPTIVLMGDSTARALDPAFLELGQRKDLTYVAAAENRCSLSQRWLADPAAQGAVRLANWQRCYDSIPQIDAVVMEYHPALIVATDRWLLVDSFNDSGQRLTAGTDAHIRDIQQRLTATATLLTSTGAKFVFIHILPVGQPTQCSDARFSEDPACKVRASDDTLTPKYNAMMDRIAASMPDRVKAIDLSDVVCPMDTCPPTLDGILMRGDGVHFTVPGARWLEPFIELKLEQVGVTP